MKNEKKTKKNGADHEVPELWGHEGLLRKEAAGLTQAAAGNKEAQQRDAQVFALNNPDRTFLNYLKEWGKYQSNKVTVKRL